MNALVDKKQWTKSLASQWHLFLPPARPSLSELAVIERYMLDMKKARGSIKVAILGSTPEYCDLCQTYNVPYTCIDYNPDAFHILGGYMRYKDTDASLAVADWRTMELKDRFDIFLGDLATTVTPVSDHPAVFEKVRKHCKDGAKVLLKTALRSSNERLSHEDIFKLYRFELSHLNPFAAVWHEVLLADYDFTRDTMHCQTSLTCLRKSFEERIITPYEFEEFKKRWDVLSDFEMNVPLQREFLKTAERYFEICEIISGSDWYKEQVPILVFRA
ncbi:MAG: hypothetical protein UW24_C0004G0032 [Parcubacteria group bacterium GW2011_GWA2_44_12]|nr:MAG: hypothetical protein UW24_C0004G0032 [Parcubacteria group bacterium GW2011_GWA2_44_12]